MTLLARALPDMTCLTELVVPYIATNRLLHTCAYDKYDVRVLHFVFGLSWFTESRLLCDRLHSSGLSPVLVVIARGFASSTSLALRR